MNRVTVPAVVSALFAKMYGPSAFLIDTDIEVDLRGRPDHLTRHTGHCHRVRI